MTIKNYIPQTPLPSTEPGVEPLPVGSPLPKKPLIEDPEAPFIRKMYGSQMNFDKRAVSDIVKSAAQKSGVRPELLFSSAIQEGMNYAITRPDDASEAYVKALEDKSIDAKAFPVDGFYNYGLDRFGENYARLKKYLPAGFEQRFKTFKAKNEKNEDISPAAFASNEDALIAKAAMLKDVQAQIEDYAKKKGIVIADEDKDYFVLASYNGGLRNGKTILEEYAKAKDKRKFLDAGETTRKEVHKNIGPRLKRMKFLKELLAENEPPKG